MYKKINPHTCEICRKISGSYDLKGFTLFRPIQVHGTCYIRLDTACKKCRKKLLYGMLAGTDKIRIDKKLTAVIIQ